MFAVKQSNCEEHKILGGNNVQHSRVEYSDPGQLVQTLPAGQSGRPGLCLRASHTSSPRTTHAHSCARCTLSVLSLCMMHAARCTATQTAMHGAHYQCYGHQTTVLDAHCKVHSHADGCKPCTVHRAPCTVHRAPPLQSAGAGPVCRSPPASVCLPPLASPGGRKEIHVWLRVQV